MLGVQELLVHPYFGMALEHVVLARRIIQLHGGSYGIPKQKNTTTKNSSCNEAGSHSRESGSEPTENNKTC